MILIIGESADCFIENHHHDRSPVFFKNNYMVTTSGVSMLRSGALMLVVNDNNNYTFWSLRRLGSKREIRRVSLIKGCQELRCFNISAS